MDIVPNHFCSHQSNDIFWCVFGNDRRGLHQRTQVAPFSQMTLYCATQAWRVENFGNKSTIHCYFMQYWSMPSHYCLLHHFYLLKYFYLITSFFCLCLPLNRYTQLVLCWGFVNLGWVWLSLKCSISHLMWMFTHQT